MSFKSITIYTSLQNDSGNISNLYFSNSIKANDFTYGNGIFVEVGYGGCIMTSQDCVKWNKAVSNTNHRLNTIMFAKDTFVYVGDKGIILISKDGVVWQKEIVNNNFDYDLTKIIWSNNTFMAVGNL